MEMMDLSSYREEERRPLFLSEGRHARLHHLRDRLLRSRDEFKKLDTVVFWSARRRFVPAFREHGLTVNLVDTEEEVCRLYDVIQKRSWAAIRSSAFAAPRS